MPPFVVAAKEEQMEVDQAEQVQQESLGDENDEEEDDQDEQPEVEDTLSDSDSDRLSQYRIEPIALNHSKRTNNSNNVAADEQQEVQNEEKGDEEAEETPKKNKFERVGSEEEVEKYEDGEEVEAAEDATNSQKKKKNKFERVWSEEDEISFLQGIMDFTNNGQGDPSVEIGKFLNFIKKYLHFIPTEHQLKDKMKRLKTKYENKAKKLGDEDPVLHRPHEHKSYLLSKQIWGSNIVKDSRTRVTNTNTNTNANTNKKNPNFGLEQMLKEFKQDSKFPILANVGVEKIVELLGTSRANELDQQWRNLFDSEIKVCLDKLDLIREQAKLISNARKRKGFL